MGSQETTIFGRLGFMLKSAKPYLLIIALQFGYAGMYIITMSTFNKGMSRYVFIVYRNAIGAVILAPFALVLERKIRPKMTFPVFWRITVLGFLELMLDQGFFFLGMMYTSTSYSTAVFNALPSITFLIAVILRIEQVRIKEARSQAKVIGTLITFGGALLLALFKGPVLNSFGSSYEKSPHENSTNSSGHSWILGTIFLFIGCVSFSIFSVLQSMVLKVYPAAMSLASMIFFLGTIQAVGIAVAVEHNPHEWALGWNSRLFAPLYAGVVTTGMAFYVQGLVMQSRGPVFVTAFTPLRLIIVTVMAIPILGEKLYLGSVIGSIVLVSGLYAVVWGKSKDPVGQKSTTATEAEPRQQQLPIAMPFPSTATEPKAQLPPNKDTYSDNKPTPQPDTVAESPTTTNK